VGAEAILIVVLAAIFGGYMAWNIGANDVANSMGTSVGSRALTIRQAIIAAAIANFLGAVLVGGHVTDTVRKKMIDPEVFGGDPQALMLGMLAALLAAGLWVQGASYFRLPVSTTHAIVGGVVGFAVIAAGPSAVAWSKIGEIVLSWVICPVIAGAGAYVLSRAVVAFIINSRDPIGATRAWTPALVFTVFATLCLVIFYKGLKNLHLDMPWQQALTIACLVGGLAAVFGWILVGRAEPTEEDHKALARVDQENTQAHLVRSLERAFRALEGAREVSGEAGASPSRVSEATALVGSLVQDVKAQAPTPIAAGDRSYRFVERVFSSLQVVSACCVAFAQGGNDVANAIGPLAAIANIAQSGTVVGQVAVPLWTLALGGAFIALGIAMWGPRVMRTVGEKITHLTPTRGFSAEFATATTVVLASRLGFPVSTTHVLIGAVIGVGIARGIASVDWRIMGQIAVTWVVQVPAVAVISAGLFVLVRAII